MISTIRTKTLIVAALVFSTSNTFARAELEVTTKKSGANTLTLLKFSTGSNEQLDFVITEPQKEDKSISLSIPAAFTTSNAGISGAAISNGHKCGGPVNTHLAGTAVYIDGNYQIFANDHGKLLSSEFLADVQSAGGSLFQQFLLVNEGLAQVFKDRALAPRRALVVFNGGSRGVAQNLTPTTMAQFAHDLQAIGVRSALYTPVGDADGGWYRNGETTVSIGKTSSSIPVQSNWVVWKKLESKSASLSVDQFLRKHGIKF